MFLEYVTPARQVADQALALVDNRQNAAAIEDASDNASY